MSTSRLSRTPSFRIVTACSSASVSCGRRRVGEGVGAERRLDLLAHRRERRVGLGGDQRRDDVERPQERLGLERREPGGAAERVAVELLVDVDVAVLGRAVDGVAAAAEVDEVQEVEALLELLRREPEAALELVGLDAARRPRRRSGRAGRPGAPGGARTARARPGRAPRGGGSGRLRASASTGAAGTARGSPVWASMTVCRSAATASTTALGLDGVRAPAEREDPRRERGEVGVGRREAGRAVGQLLELAVGAVPALDQPGGVGARPRSTAVPTSLGRELPRRPVAVGGDVEVGGDPEVALAAGRELDLAADARDAERAPAVVVGVAVEVVADDVPDAVHLPQAVRVDGALGLAVAGDRPVAEPHGALLRDGLLELRQAGRDLVGVERGQELDGRRLGPGVGARPGPAEREVLEREPQRLGVGELALEQVEAGLERRQLVVVERRSAAGSTAPRAGCRAPPPVNSSRLDAIGIPRSWSSRRSA